MDRGGLTLVNPTAFTFFQAIEKVTYRQLECVLQGNQPQHKKVTAAVVCENEHLQFLWATLSLDISSEQNSQALLKEIVEFWIKIRGHSVASMIVESYKQHKAKNVKGAKGIRKQLKLGESLCYY